jgi:hypothetical protein
MTDNGAKKTPTHSVMFLYVILKQNHMAFIFGRKIFHPLSSIDPYPANVENMVSS